MNPFRPGDDVWFQPATIGYGYFYGVDVGIPARVIALTPKRCTITFKAKDGTPVPRRHVAFTNLVPRP